MISLESFVLDLAPKVEACMISLESFVLDLAPKVELSDLSAQIIQRAYVSGPITGVTK